MSVLTLADAKIHLNINVSTTDVELQAFIDAAESAIAAKVGPLSVTAGTDRVRGAGKELILPRAPVVAVTAITPVGGSALDLSSVVVDYRAGIIAYVAATQYNFARFPLPWYDVTYTAGRSTVPADMLHAVKELVRHLWETQRGTGSTPRPGTEDDVPWRSIGVVGAYSFPNRVLELLSPYMLTGFA